jgi:hypothetical protein
MVAEKKAQGAARFGARASVLLSQNFSEYLARGSAAASPGLVWLRRHIRYPLRYEMRPSLARLNSWRVASRFDLRTACFP